MKKYLSLMSILALAACASGGSPDGRFTVTSTSRYAFVTEDAVNSNKNVTSMDSEIIICDDDACPAHINRYISNISHQHPRGASTNTNDTTKALQSGEKYSVYGLNNASFTTDDANGDEKFVFSIDETENSKNRGRIESVKYDGYSGVLVRTSDSKKFMNTQDGATFTYNSYDSMVKAESKLNLRFSDFGKVTFSDNDTGDNAKDYMFAGGYKELRKTPENNATMDFRGTASGVVSKGGTPQEINGPATLKFNAGTETLNMAFSGGEKPWYDVKIVKSDNENTISFSKTNNVSVGEIAFNDTDFTNGVKTENFVPSNMNIGYYGVNKNNIKEATGVVNYTEGDINMQAAFGAKLNETNTNN